MPKPQRPGFSAECHRPQRGQLLPRRGDGRRYALSGRLLEGAEVVGGADRAGDFVRGAGRVLDADARRDDHRPSLPASNAVSRGFTDPGTRVRLVATGAGIVFRSRPASVHRRCLAGVLRAALGGAGVGARGTRGAQSHDGTQPGLEPRGKFGFGRVGDGPRERPRPDVRFFRGDGGFDFGGGFSLRNPRERDRRKASDRSRRREKTAVPGCGNCCTTGGCSCPWRRPLCFIWPTPQ